MRSGVMGGSTDAAMVNVPLAMELALNQGKCFGSFLRIGAKTLPVERMKSIDDVAAAFVTQLNHMVGRMIKDLKAIERAHARYRPVPLTSLFIDGCLASGTCATQGAARYNFSGIQGVGMATAGDSLCAIERLVFQDKKISLDRLREVLAAREADPYWFTFMRKAPKFGNNDTERITGQNSWSTSTRRYEECGEKHPRRSISGRYLFQYGAHAFRQEDRRPALRQITRRNIPLGHGAAKRHGPAADRRR